MHHRRLSRWGQPGRCEVLLDGEQRCMFHTGSLFLSGRIINAGLSWLHYEPWYNYLVKGRIFHTKQQIICQCVLVNLRHPCGRVHMEAFSANIQLPTYLPYSNWVFSFALMVDHLTNTEDHSSRRLLEDLFVYKGTEMTHSETVTFRSLSVIRMLLSCLERRIKKTECAVKFCTQESA